MRAKTVQGFFLVVTLILSLFLSVFSSLAAEKHDPLQEEISMGTKVAEDVDTHFERVEDPVVLARLNMIFRRLVPFTERPFPYQVRIVREERPNAFSLPGGIIYMTTGMISFCRSDAELAAVLAHELIHADRGHVMLQVARNRKLNLVALAVAIASKGEMAALIAGNLAQVAIMNSYSRDLEEEADRIGLEVLHGGGYSPAGMVTMLERLAEERLKRPWRDPGIYQDHPDVSDRVDYVIEQIHRSGWPLHRKESLHLLRVALNKDGKKDRRVLSIDGTVLFSVSDESENRRALQQIGDVLRRNLQLEMFPGEIQVLPGGKELRVGNSRVPLIDEAGHDPEIIRAKLVDILLEAKSSHPVAEYMR